MPVDGTSARAGDQAIAVVNDTLVLRLKTFTVNPTTGESVWGDSGSEGHTFRKGARKDCTGNMVGVLDGDTKVYDIFMPGDIVKLTLWETQVGQDYWHFPSALIQNFSLTFNQDTKEVVEWTADFGTDGVFYRPGEAGGAGQTVPS